MAAPECIQVLAATPIRLRELTRGLSPARLRARPSRDEWSVNEVLAHLRACADARGECIPRIVAEDHPTFRAVNPLSWIEQTGYRDLEFASSLRAFTTQRAALVTLLQSLPA